LIFCLIYHLYLKLKTIINFNQKSWFKFKFTLIYNVLSIKILLLFFRVVLNLHLFLYLLYLLFFILLCLRLAILFSIDSSLFEFRPNCKVLEDYRARNSNVKACSFVAVLRYVNELITYLFCLVV